jgi:hypothetical protein
MRTASSTSHCRACAALVAIAARSRSFSYFSVASCMVNRTHATGTCEAWLSERSSSGRSSDELSTAFFGAGTDSAFTTGSAEGGTKEAFKSRTISSNWSANLALSVVYKAYLRKLHINTKPEAINSTGAKICPLAKFGRRTGES